MPVQVEPASKTRIKLKEGGCYLITGGTGRIGLLFAEFLAVAAKAKLVLMGHSTLPEEEVWDQWLANHDWNDANSRIINKLRELKAIGSEVEIISADLADEKQMERAVASMVERFGPINGVIHSAGRAGEKSIRMIEELDREECERHFQSKIYGLKSLERALVNEPLDFFLLQSSLSSILGGLGFSAYSAANHFMDAFAEWRNRSNSTRCVSVNWDGWRLGDEAVIHARPGARLQAAAIEPAEGVEALEYLLTMEGMPRVIVSTSDLQRRVDEWIELQSPGGMDAGDSGVISLYPRRNLSNEYIAPTDELEREIAEMCRSLLGIEQVGLNDNFFEMGGHSLLAIQLIARLREVFHIEISLRGFFESPTVLNLAETVRKFRETASQPQSDPIIRVLRDRHRVEITSEGKMSLPEALRKR
jgi:NAD(P)-dependent dehydrogenase (short-subunit alcohol dehydrogenase family)